MMVVGKKEVTFKSPAKRSNLELTARFLNHRKLGKPNLDSQSKQLTAMLGLTFSIEGRICWRQDSRDWIHPSNA